MKFGLFGFLMPSQEPVKAIRPLSSLTRGVYVRVVVGYSGPHCICEVNIFADGVGSAVLEFGVSGLCRGSAGLMRRPVCQGPTFPLWKRHLNF